VISYTSLTENKPVSGLVFGIFSVKYHDVMTSSLTSQGLDIALISTNVL